MYDPEDVGATENPINKQNMKHIFITYSKQIFIRIFEIYYTPSGKGTGLPGSEGPVFKPISLHIYVLR